MRAHEDFHVRNETDVKMQVNLTNKIKPEFFFLLLFDRSISFIWQQDNYICQCIIFCSNKNLECILYTEIGLTIRISFVL